MKRIVGSKDDDLAACWLNGDKVFMRDGKATTIGEMNPKRAERLGMEHVADLVDFHTILPTP